MAGEVTRYNYRITPYRKPFLIYNPVAGKIRRNPERILQRTIAALRRANVEEVLLLPTGKAGHGAELARHAMERGADLILVLGGDGTINEVANGMIGSEVALGILPGGTANVLCMELGLGRDLDRAISTYRASLGYDPRHEKTLQNLITALLEKGDAAAARGFLARLEQVNPNNEALAQFRARLGSQ